MDDAHVCGTRSHTPRDVRPAEAGLHGERRRDGNHMVTTPSLYGLSHAELAFLGVRGVLDLFQRRVHIGLHLQRCQLVPSVRVSCALLSIASSLSRRCSPLGARHSLSSAWVPSMRRARLTWPTQFSAMLLVHCKRAEPSPNVTPYLAPHVVVSWFLRSEPWSQRTTTG